MIKIKKSQNQGTLTVTFTFPEVVNGLLVNTAVTIIIMFSYWFELTVVFSFGRTVVKLD